MPTYQFRNIETNEEFEDFMSISACEEFLENNKHISQLPSSPAIVSSAMGGTTKPDAGFRDMLKQIKRSNSKGFKRANINTF